MKFKNLFWSAIYALAICALLASCDNSENNNDLPNDGSSKVELPAKRAYILYEGQWGSNNSGIAFYAPEKDADFISDIFKLQNSKALGSLANTFIEYNDHIYVVVSDSKYISMLNEACVEVNSYKIPEGEGSPRQITAYDGFIYVTQWGGKVTKLNAKTMEPAAESFSGGGNLEGIEECGGKIYVTNSYNNDGGYTYNKEMFEINPNTMELEKTYNVWTNPERLLEENDKIYLHARGNYEDIQGMLQEIDTKTGNIKDIAQIGKMAKAGNGMLYLVNPGDITVNPSAPQNRFFQYNTKTGETVNESFLKDAPKELDNSNIYLLAVDHETGEIYVGVADYVNTGTIYKFAKDGTFKEKFDAGGINPNNMIFIY